MKESRKIIGPGSMVMAACAALIGLLFTYKFWYASDDVPSLAYQLLCATGIAASRLMILAATTYVAANITEAVIEIRKRQ